MSARQNLRADLRRYFTYLGKRDRPLARLAVIAATEGIWALIAFRLGQWIYQETPRWFARLMHLPFQVGYKVVQWITGIHLSSLARVGPGLYIGHYGGIWVSPRAVLGSHCSLSQGVTIGTVADKGGPVLGDRVWVGPGATISGPVRIGSGAVIGANSLVAANIPENGVAVGVPARVISLSGSAHLLNLPDESADPPPGRPAEETRASAQPGEGEAR